jgi:hypothetical protein
MNWKENMVLLGEGDGIEEQNYEILEVMTRLIVQDFKLS